MLIRPNLGADADFCLASSITAIHVPVPRLQCLDACALPPLKSATYSQVPNQALIPSERSEPRDLTSQNSETTKHSRPTQTPIEANPLPCKAGEGRGGGTFAKPLTRKDSNS
ncbi:MAG: hypothetical protein Tsb0027_09210 [Wenzhouxiangellaceae bacterium]